MALKKFEKSKNRQAGLASSQEIENANLMPAGYVGDAQQRQIPIDLIAYHPDNDYRSFETGEEDIERFAGVIEKDGFHGSLVVVEKQSTEPGRGGKEYLLLGGERRLRALRLLCEKNKELRIRYATVPCTVVTNLSADPDLRHRQEMLILDGDNIHTRGGLTGIGDDAFAAKVTSRYVENMMKVYGLNETEAKRTLKEATQHNNDRTIDRNWRLYKQLTRRMFVIYLSGSCDVDKHTLEKLTALSEAEQNTLADALEALSAHRGSEEIGYQDLVRQLRDALDELMYQPAGESRPAQVAQIKADTLAALDDAKRRLAARQQEAAAREEAERQRLAALEKEEAEEEKKRLAALKRKAQREAAANAPAELIRKKFTDSVDKSIDTLRKLGKKDSLRRLRGVNREGALTQKLDELEAAIAALRDGLGDA